MFHTQQNQMSSLDHETLYIHFVLDNLVSHKQRTWHRDRIHHVDMQSVGLKENLCSPARVTGYILYYYYYYYYYYITHHQKVQYEKEG